MTDAEKIEALREWAGQDFPDEWASGASGRGEYWRGYFAAAKMVRDIIDPPKPKWRELVDETAAAEKRHWLQEPLASALYHLHLVAAYERAEPREHLANIVAVCEDKVGDGWQADPDRVPVGHWGIPWLLVPLSHEPPDWKIVGHRSAAWLRSLTDGVRHE